MLLLCPAHCRMNLLCILFFILMICSYWIEASETQPALDTLGYIDRRAKCPPDGKWLPPPMDLSNARAQAKPLPTFTTTSLPLHEFPGLEFVIRRQENKMETQFPLDIKPVNDEEHEIIKKYYKSYTRRFLRVGPQGYLSTPGHGDHASDIYNLEVRPDDVWVTTFSRSGTTWLQELVWLVANDLDFENATSTPITKRYAYIEYPTLGSDIPKGPATNSSHRATFEDFRTLANVMSPRFVKSHLPLSQLPPSLIDTAKVFYIARDIRDVAVSFHFAHKLFRYFDDDVTFKEFWDLFKNNLILHTPIFPHVEEAWRQRNHPNLMFLFYEEMQNDLPGVIDRVCVFLGREYSTEQKERLARHLSFDNMKKGPTLIESSGQPEKTFFRKGTSGGWVEYFDEEMKKEAEEYIQKNLQKTDMRYPIIINKRFKN